MHSRRFWLVMIFAGWSFDFLFWKQAFGVNFAIFVSLCLAAGIALLGSEGIRPARKSLLLVPLIILEIIQRQRMFAVAAIDEIDGDLMSVSESDDRRS